MQRQINCDAQGRAQWRVAAARRAHPGGSATRSGVKLSCHDRPGSVEDSPVAVPSRRARSSPAGPHHLKKVDVGIQCMVGSGPSRPAQTSQAHGSAFGDHHTTGSFRMLDVERDPLVSQSGVAPRRSPCPLVLGEAHRQAGRVGGSTPCVPGSSCHQVSPQLWEELGAHRCDPSTDFQDAGQIIERRPPASTPIETPRTQEPGPIAFGSVFRPRQAVTSAFARGPGHPAGDELHARGQVEYCAAIAVAPS